MIAIVNTGGANIASVVNAFSRLGVHSELTEDPEVIQSASHVILPGVGAAADSMGRLREKQLPPLIEGLTQPVLGICLGMQLLFEKSEEGPVDCLGILPGTVTEMTPDPEAGITIPHMGWNQLEVRGEPVPLLKDLPADPYVYFVHSYCAPEGDFVKATATHGQSVPAVVVRDNFMGAQFHPERSGETGAVILRNFISL